MVNNNGTIKLVENFIHSNDYFFRQSVLRPSYVLKPMMETCFSEINPNGIISQLNTIKRSKLCIKHVQVRKATVIKKDGIELTRSFERFVLDPGNLMILNNFVDNTLFRTSKTTNYRGIEQYAQCFYSDVKTAWKQIIAEKSSE